MTIAKWMLNDHTTTEFKFYGGVYGSYGGGVGKANVGDVIGQIRLQRPIEYTRKSYETASWWMKLEAQAGTYDVRLAKGYHSSHQLLAVANIPAIKRDGYFPSSWCGVPIGKYDFREAGEMDTLGMFMELGDACLESARVSSEGVEGLIDFKYWDIAEADHQARLDYSYASLADYWTKSKAGSDKFHSEMGMVAHVGGVIQKHAHMIQELRRRRDSWNEPHRAKYWKLKDVA